MSAGCGARRTTTGKAPATPRFISIPPGQTWAIAISPLMPRSPISSPTHSSSGIWRPMPSVSVSRADYVSTPKCCPWSRSAAGFVCISRQASSANTAPSSSRTAICSIHACRTSPAPLMASRSTRIITAPRSPMRASGCWWWGLAILRSTSPWTSAGKRRASFCRRGGAPGLCRNTSSPAYRSGLRRYRTPGEVAHPYSAPDYGAAGPL